MATLLLKPQTGPALVIGQPNTRVTSDVAEVWMAFADAKEKAWFVGYASPGAPFKMDFNPIADKDVIFFLVSQNKNGAANVSQLSEAPSYKLTINRETVAPTLTQAANATNTLVRVGVSGYSRFARKRKIEVSPNSDMSGATVQIQDSVDYKTRGLPDYVNVERDPASGTLTRYVRVSHAVGDAYGPVSNILTITFADSGGSGGSGGGDFTPGGGDQIEINQS